MRGCGVWGWVGEGLLGERGLHGCVCVCFFVGGGISFGTEASPRTALGQLGITKDFLLRTIKVPMHFQETPKS